MRQFYSKVFDVWLIINGSLMVILLLLALAKIKLVENIAPIFIISVFSMCIFVVVVGLYYTIKDKYGKEF